jgi:hypothetical protein
MPTRASSGKKRDFTQIAKSVIDKATGDNETTAIIEEIKTVIPKNPHAQALSALGASKGGKARAKKLSTKRKREIARKAARARWKKA